MNDKFTEDFIKEQLSVMEKFEKADCSPSSDYIAGRNAAIQNYPDALRKILLLEHEIRSWCKDMSTICEQANIMLNQRDEIEEGLNKRIADLEELVDELVDSGDNLFDSLNPIAWKHEWLDKWWKLSTRIRREREE